jgi:hypothetical protein
MNIKATVIERASTQLIKAIKEAEREISQSDDPEIKDLYGAQLVLKKIESGEQNLFDPKNPGDMIILTMAGWD